MIDPYKDLSAINKAKKDKERIISVRKVGARAQKKEDSISANFLPVPMLKRTHDTIEQKDFIPKVRGGLYRKDKEYLEFLAEQERRKEKVMDEWGFFPPPFNRREEMFEEALEGKELTPKTIGHFVVYPYSTYTVIPQARAHGFYTYPVTRTHLKLLEKTGYYVPDFKIMELFEITKTPQYRSAYAQTFLEIKEYKDKHGMYDPVGALDFTEISIGLLLSEYFQQFFETDPFIFAKVILLAAEYIDLEERLFMLREIEVSQKEYRFPPEKIKKIFWQY